MILALGLKEHALHLLGAAPQSEGRLRSRLQAKSDSEEEIEGVIEELRQQGFVDDTQLVESFLQNRLASKGLSYPGLGDFFTRHRIPKSLWKPLFEDHIQSEFGSRYAWECAQLKMIFSKKPSMMQLAQEKVLRRLTQKGFSYQAARDVYAEFARGEDESAGF